MFEGGSAECGKFECIEALAWAKASVKARTCSTTPLTQHPTPEQEVAHVRVNFLFIKGSRHAAIQARSGSDSTLNGTNPLQVSPHILMRSGLSPTAHVLNPALADVTQDPCQ